ncbi:TPA: hypothetical protein ACSRP2_004846, partial [Enterobacter hormaechei subsp. hoffmannii]
MMNSQPMKASPVFKISVIVISLFISLVEQDSRVTRIGRYFQPSITPFTGSEIYHARMLVLRASDIFQFIIAEKHRLSAVRAVASVITISAPNFVNYENFVGSHVTILYRQRVLRHTAMHQSDSMSFRLVPLLIDTSAALHVKTA